MSRKSNSSHEGIWANIIHGDCSGYTDIVFQENSISDNSLFDLMVPKAIVTELNKRVIGQRQAKELLATAVWNRLLSLNNRAMERNEDDFYFEKNNLLLIGSSGCGKTHLMKSLAEITSLPLIIEDATLFTSAGYVGRDVDTVIDKLFDVSHDRIKRLAKESNLFINDTRMGELTKRLSEFGIIYIDEADKMRASIDQNGKDVNGRGVQEAFLKLIEGRDMYLSHKAYNGKFNTSNILFVFGGAFSMIDRIVQMRTSPKTIGFHDGVIQSRSNILSKILPEDLIKYGMMPELLGRLPTIAVFDEIDEAMLYKILTEPKHCILRQLINEFRSYGVEVSFTDEAISYIVKYALASKLGSRGLKAACQQLLRPLLFNLPSSNIKSMIVTKDLLESFREIE